MVVCFFFWKFEFLLVEGKRTVPREYKRIQDMGWTVVGDHDAYCWTCLHKPYISNHIHMVHTWLVVQGYDTWHVACWRCDAADRWSMVVLSPGRKQFCEFQLDGSQAVAGWWWWCHDWPIHNGIFPFKWRWARLQQLQPNCGLVQLHSLVVSSHVLTWWTWHGPKPFPAMIYVPTVKVTHPCYSWNWITTSQITTCVVRLDIPFWAILHFLGRTTTVFGAWLNIITCWAILPVIWLLMPWMYISTQMGTAQSYLPAELDQLYCKTDLTCSFCGPLRSCYPPFAPQPGHQSQVARRSGPVEGRGRPKNGGLTRNSWPCGESHALNHGLKWGHLAGPRILWSHQRYVARHTHTHTPHRHTHTHIWKPHLAYKWLLYQGCFFTCL